MQNDCEGGVILESCNENVIEILSDTNIKIKIKKIIGWGLEAQIHSNLTFKWLIALCGFWSFQL